MGLCLGFHRTKREKSGGQKQAKCAPPLSVLDLVRTSTNADKRTDFFERDAGCRERGVAGRDEDRRECLAQIRNSGKAGGVEILRSWKGKRRLAFHPMARQAFVF